MSTLASKVAARTHEVVAVLSDRWRVIDAPAGWAPQWVLQQRVRRPTATKDGWTARSYCTSRIALQRCVREYCREVDAVAKGIIEALPEKHPR